MCPVCRNNEKESIAHIFINFKAIKPSWESIGWHHCYKDSGDHWLIQLKIFKYIMTKNLINWDSLLPFIIWYTWTNRNNNNHKNTSSLINGDFIFKKAIEYKLLTEKSIFTPPKIPINAAWHKPQKGWAKLNIDASYNTVTQKSGLRGTFINSKGHWIVGFGKLSYASGSLEAELKAMLEGLKMAKEWNLYPLEIESDFVEAIQSIFQGNMVYDDIVNACRWLMHKQKEIILRHTFRWGENAAHHMEKKAKEEREGMKIFVEGPSYVKCFVEKELLEGSYRRQID